MAVTLRLSGGDATGISGTKTLARGTLSIGRGQGNDWVLPDPDRHLSKTHCVLSMEGGRVVLTDVSTNGVHINGARQATARDSRTVLTDGDSFRLGDYTVTVSEAAEAARGWGGAGPADPFDGPAGPDEGASPLDVDPLDDPLGRAPHPGFSHHLPPRTAGPSRADPFDVAEERAHRVPDPDDDLFRGTRPTAEWQGPAQPDNADAARHSFVPPAVLPPVADPAGIDFDALIGDLGPALGRPSPPAPRPASPRPPAPPPPPLADADPFADPQPRPAAPARVAPLDDPFAEVPSPPPRPAVPPPPPPVAAPSAPVAPTPPPVTAEAPPAPAPHSQPQAPTADAQAVLAAFLQAAGVAGAGPAAADPVATLRLVGEVFRAMTEGLRELLLSRAAIKSDMRVEQTMIRARDNNPLKFSVTADDAVAALLAANRPGYMAPLASTREAFHDIKMHELAVMAGVQTALASLLARFDPQTLEKRMAAGRLASVLPGARKARYWDNFTEVYAEIAREAEDDFQAVFGRSFAKAYTAQTRKESGD